MRKWAAAGALAALGLLPVTAQAKADDRGVEVQLNGGVVSFPGSVDVDTGAAYGVNVGLEPFSSFELELGYQGAAYAEDGFKNNSTIGAVENGGYAAAKISPLAGVVEPYLLGGIGVAHVNVTDGSEAGEYLQDDTIGKVPVGAGVDVQVDAFTVGVRGTYDFVFENENAFKGDSSRDSDQLFGTLHLGAQF